MFSFYSGVATIIMLHRVFPHEADKLSPNEGLKVSPEFLEKFIVDAVHSGYRFISLDELHHILSKGKKISKSIVMTLDDGYADNYTYAYPIFKKYNIPFAIYLTTSFPDRSAVLWWYQLEDFLVENDYISLTNGMHFQCGTKKQRVEAFMALRKVIIYLPEENFLSSLNELFENFRCDWQQKVFDLAISWEQLIKICADPLVTIGAHTKNHFALAGLSHNALIDEVVDSKLIIESRLPIHVKHFCYPFGSRAEAGDREFNVIKELGFDTAVTTRFGNIFPEHSDYLTSLPRVMLTERFSWSAFHFRLIKQYLKGPVVTV